MYLTPEEHTEFLKSRREAQVLAQHYKMALIRIKQAPAVEQAKFIASNALENVPQVK